MNNLNSEISAIILAGGRGTRMGETPESTPKYLLEIGGKPILSYHIDKLIKMGFVNIKVLSNAKSEILQEYLDRNYSKNGCIIEKITDGEIAGTAGALMGVIDQVKPNVLVCYGDTFHNVNLEQFLKFHLDKNSAFTTLIHSNNHPADSDQVEVVEDLRISQVYSKKSVKPKDLRNHCMGALFAFSSEWFKSGLKSLFINEAKEIDFIDDYIVHQSTKDSRMFAYLTSEYIHDVGTPERLDRVKKDYQNSFVFRQDKRPTVFLDRDGTLIKSKGYIVNPDQVELLSGASKFVKQLNELGVLCIVITNQPVVARGDCTSAQIEKIHGRLENLLVEDGAILDGIYYCPHHPERGFENEIKELKIECNCRKPKIGLFKEAFSMHHVDLSKAWFIGNSSSDAQAAKLLGIDYFSMNEFSQVGTEIQFEGIYRFLEGYLK